MSESEQEVIERTPTLDVRIVDGLVTIDVNGDGPVEMNPETAKGAASSIRRKAKKAADDRESLKLRKAPPEHAYNWVLTVDGSVIDGFESRTEALEESSNIADKVGVGVDAQHPAGEWEPEDESTQEVSQQSQ